MKNELNTFDTKEIIVQDEVLGYNNIDKTRKLANLLIDLALEAHERGRI